LATERPVATVLAAKNIRPDYVSGDSFRYLVITGGKVAALAKTADEAARHAGPSARHADLGDACVGPGFIDTHIHALQAAADVRLVSLREATTLDGLLSAVREAGLGRTADTWTVTGRNWHESWLPERRLPTRADLDALGLPGPVLVRRGSHLAVANSRAIALLGAASLPGGAAETGQIHADALIARALALAGEPTARQRRDDLALVLERFATRGITTIREAGVDGAELGLFQAVRDQGRLPMRCDLLWRIPEGSDADTARQLIAAMPQPGPADDPWLRLTGVKAFVDGRIADAAIGDDRDSDHLRITPPDLQMIVEGALSRSAGVGCHAVGDAAVRVVLDAYQRALAAGLVTDPGRLVVEHALSCAPETIARLAASGIGVSVHPAIVYEFADDVRRYWGAERTARAAPVRDMVAAGVRIAAGSDGDVPPFDPLRSISFMVTRSPRSGGPIGESQAVDQGVALDLYTRCGAALLGTGTRRGRLRPGMEADLALFSADPLSCPAAELPYVEVLATMLGGKPVHDPGRLMEGIGGA
jgi:predicted amidohydrolase YtcJ